MVMTEWLGISDWYKWLIISILFLGGTFFLKTAWKNNSDKKPVFIVCGWLFYIISFVISGYFWGAVKGVSIALAIISLIAMMVIIPNLKIRNSKTREPRDIALEPSDRQRVVWRGWLRGFLAGPLAGIAALGVGLAVAICAPGEPQTRMVIGGLIVPFLWAGGMAWTLSDNKIIRATFVLVGVATVSFAAAFLKGTIS